MRHHMIRAGCGMWLAGGLAGCGANFLLPQPLQGECRTTFTFFRDADGDGWGTPATGQSQCEGDVETSFTARNGLDCDDEDASVTMGQLGAQCPQSLLVAGDGRVPAVSATVFEGVERVLVAVDDVHHRAGVVGEASVDVCAQWGLGINVPPAEEGGEAVMTPRARLAAFPDDAVLNELLVPFYEAAATDVTDLLVTVDARYARLSGSTAETSLSAVWADGVGWRGEWVWFANDGVSSIPANRWCGGQAPLPEDWLGDLTPADANLYGAIDSRLTELRAVVRSTRDDAGWTPACLDLARPAEGGGRLLVGLACERNQPQPADYVGFGTRAVDVP